MQVIVLCVFFKSHGYEDPNPPKVLTEKSKAKVVEAEKKLLAVVVPPAEEEESIETVVNKGEEDEEKEWLSQPISLKILKQKLYKSFTIKWVSKPRPISP